MKDKYEEKVKPYLTEIKEALINKESHKTIYTRFGITKTTLYAYREKYSELNDLFNEKNLKKWRQDRGESIEPVKKTQPKTQKAKKTQPVKNSAKPDDLIAALKKLAEDETILLTKEITEVTCDQDGVETGRKVKFVGLKFSSDATRETFGTANGEFQDNLDDLASRIKKASDSCDDNSEFLKTSVANLRIEIQSKDEKIKGLHAQIKGMRQENEKRIKTDAKTINKLENRMKTLEEQEQDDIDSLKGFFEGLGAE